VAHALSETVPLTAVAAVSVNIAEALNEAKVISASWAHETYSFLTAAQKYEVEKRAAEHGVTTTIRYYGKVAISTDLAQKESSMRRFKNAYRERSKLFHKEVLLRQWEHSKHLYIRGIPHHT